MKPTLRWRLLGPLLAPLLALALAGCDKDEVRTYDVPRSPESQSDKPRARLLGAIVPRGEDAWVFKLTGPAELVTAQEETFKGVLKSVEFSDKADAPLAYKTPEGWKNEKGPEPRYATLKQEKGPLELTVSKLPVRGADTLANVNRWRKNDLGLGPVGKGSLDRYSKEERLAGQVFTLVDITGPGPQLAKGKGPGGMGGGMGGGGGGVGEGPGGGMPARPGKLPITYTVPAGWNETGPRGTMVLTAFRLEEGTGKAELTVFPPGITGDLRANVNRWRGQVGQPDLSQADFAQASIPPVKVGGRDGKFVDLTGGGKRMLVVVVGQGERNWFFKFFGDADLVGKQKGNFESFIQSVKFTGAADE